MEPRPPGFCRTQCMPMAAEPVVPPALVQTQDVFGGMRNNGRDDRSGVGAGPIQRRHCDQDVIELSVRWYLSFNLSSRDLVQ